jgi:quinol monooxygenase YgiN
MPQLQIIARHTVISGKEDGVSVALLKLIDASRSEPGVLEIDAYQSVEDPRSFVLLERYASRQAFADHVASPHFREFLLGHVVSNHEHRIVEQYEVGAHGVVPVGALPSKAQRVA